MTAVAARGLVIGRGAFRAGPFDLAIPQGALVAVLGPNGGGKTTLLKTLAGLIAPIAGQVERAAPAPAYLPPPGAIESGLAAGYLVALGRAGRRGLSPGLGAEDRAAAAAAMATLGIEQLADRPLDRLSSGQQQLVLIARMLVQRSALCLLDEPTAMLDPAQTARIDRAIDMLADAGRTVIVSTHRPDFAARAALVIAIGSEVAAGPPGAVMTPDALSAFYGTPMMVCACCGHWSCVTTRA